MVACYVVSLVFVLMGVACSCLEHCLWVIVVAFADLALVVDLA